MARQVSQAREQLERGYVELAWRRAERDPLWFFENCVQIPSQRDPSGREPFELWDFQHEDLDAFHNERFVVVLKCRQIGLSTLVGAYALWMALFHPGSVILWISDGQDNANKAIGMLDVMWRFLPQWVRDRAPELTGDQAGKKEWTFADGMSSRIRAYAGTGKAGASETASLVVLDEFALVEDQDNLMRSADPTTDAGGKLWVISTARGAHNRFATTYRAAARGDSKFRALFHPWMVSRWVNPKAQQVAACPACEGQGVRSTREGLVYCRECVDTSIFDSKAREFADQPWLFSAEYPHDEESAFLESGRPRFHALPRLEDCDNDWVRGELRWAPFGESLLFEPADDGPLRMRPADVQRGHGHPRCDYVVYVDPSQGVGGDATAGQVLTLDEDGYPERVAWWHSNRIEPAEAARRMDMLGRWFAGTRRAAKLAVETQGGFGDSMLQELHTHLRYPNLYAHRPVGNRKRTSPQKLGFPMHWQRRPLVVDRLAEYVTTAVDGGPLLVGIDPMLRHELGTFVKREDGKVAADVGCHDDLVMSAAGALWVLMEEGRATQPPDGEEPEEPAPAHNNLQGMFDQIEDKRRQEEERNRRQARRSQIRSSRRAVTMGRGRR